MVEYLRHYVAGLIIFAGLISLYSAFYLDIETNYNITRDNVTDDNIMESIEDINIISSINETATNFYKLSNPTNTFDLLGAMALAGYGVIKIIGSTITLPIEIIGVVTTYYYIPPIVSTILGILVILYIGFILVSIYMKEKV